MSNARTNSKKASKNVRNVLVQPYDVIWPLIEGDDFEECSRYLQHVDRKNIVTGCNPVIKLLQNGEAAAFLIHRAFHPRVFGKILIQMARKRNAAVLVLVLPALPDQSNTSGMMMAITQPKQGEPQPSAVKELLGWMKGVCLRNEFVTAQSLRVKSVPKRRVQKKVKKRPDKPMTDEEVAKLYVMEPISDGARSAKQRRNECGLDKGVDFISFSDPDRSVIIQSKHDRAPVVPLIDRSAGRKAYIPLTVNKVQGNPNRVEHKKKKKNLTSK